MNPLNCSTLRFFVVRDPARAASDPVLDIMYRGDLNRPAREFAHVWQVRGWEPEREGQWTFNRSDVAIENRWWPAIYDHDTLQAMLDHIEATFEEGVPANQPS